MSDTKDKLIEQAGGVLEKAYEDMVHPSAMSIGNTLSLVPRTIGVWLGKWEKWIVNGEESIKLTAAAVKGKAAQIPEEKLTEPEAYVAIPAIQQLSYCYDSEELREMYANLLVSSMNTDTKNQVHPSYVDIIKQLSPLDAVALNEIAKIGSAIPVMMVKLNYHDTDSFFELLKDYTVELFSVYQTVKIMNAGLKNLERLGLIDIHYDQVVRPDSRYDIFKEDALYTDMIDRHQHIEDTYISTVRGLIELTEFGLAFCKICCA